MEGTSRFHRSPPLPAFSSLPVQFRFRQLQQFFFHILNIQQPCLLASWDLSIHRETETGASEVFLRECEMDIPAASFRRALLALRGWRGNGLEWVREVLIALPTPGNCRPRVIDKLVLHSGGLLGKTGWSWSRGGGRVRLPSRIHPRQRRQVPVFWSWKWIGGIAGCFTAPEYEGSDCPKRGVGSCES